MDLRVNPDEFRSRGDIQHMITTFEHLQVVGIGQQQINTLLNPIDHQDASLAYNLLRVLWTLPDAPATASPNFIRARVALQIFGRLAQHLVTQENLEAGAIGSENLT
ncbi:hypothetical protein DFH07DRAFT_819397 [Mycena maculata]|uniref:Uncharacterized protein n=1 Tax=Mycena maculata TaxID=230809 RepID=A0AAD7IBJ8_9AGAR|nr:hypothetical protein DFH07DRAFT_840163 [Mycena maculata]KAJ7757335.1 hypothetical protein DFH07DRAFT_819397 [Mycena maculata]